MRRLIKCYFSTISGAVVGEPFLDLRLIFVRACNCLGVMRVNIVGCTALLLIIIVCAAAYRLSTKLFTCIIGSYC